MIGTRSKRASFALLALALFTAWLGAGVIHHHAPTPDCQFCKVAPGGVADLAPLPHAPAPSINPERIAPVPADAHAERLAAIPRGRSPPTT